MNGNLSNVSSRDSNAVSIDVPIQTTEVRSATLHWGCEHDQRKLIDAINHKQEDINVVDENGRTALHIASIHGNVSAMEVLLRYDADVHAADKSGWTALHWASCYGYLPAVELLLKQGSDINKPTDLGVTALHTACENDEIELVEVADFLLQHGAYVNAKTQGGETPLHFASCRGHTTIIELLLNHQANPDASKEYGWTALHRACQFGHMEAATLLLNFIDVNATTKGGDTALTCSDDDVLLRKFLLSKGAHIHHKNIQGLSVIELARNRGHRNAVEHLSTFG